jgi:excisionase family DNA binding protein
MTVKEAAEYLAVPAPTLYTRVWQRAIPFVRLGRSLRFDRNDLDALIEANKVRPSEEWR